MNRILIFLAIILAFTYTAIAATCPAETCAPPSRCVADDVCVCYGKHLKAYIHHDAETGSYKQTCENLRQTGWKGFWISMVVLVCSLIVFYVIGESQNKQRKSPDFKASTEYLSLKNKAK